LNNSFDWKCRNQKGTTVKHLFISLGIKRGCLAIDLSARICKNIGMATLDEKLDKSWMKK